MQLANGWRKACLLGGLVLFGQVAVRGDDPPPPTTLALTREEPERTNLLNNAKLLVREIARQSVLVAAREELGASTRDMTLRETVPPKREGKVLPLRIQAGMTSRVAVHVLLMSGDADDHAPALDETIELPPKPGVYCFDYATFVIEAEKRSRGTFVEALRQHGFSGKAVSYGTTAKVPVSVAKWLEEMNIFSQFAAARELHARARENGHSAETLGSLVRAYANLGQLTSFLWNASCKDYWARALVYSQRLVELDQSSAWSLEHRAYARAMCGLHAAALEDLAAAAKLAPADGNTASAPNWVPLIEAMCRYDRKPFEGEQPEELKQLAALCGFLIVADSRVENQMLTTGRKSLEAAPECLVICDAMGNYSGVQNRHQTTVYGPLVMLQRLAFRLKDMSDLPQAVRKLAVDPDLKGLQVDPALADGEARQQLIAALVAAGENGKDSGEPSWESLGRMIEDITFVHVYRRLQFFHTGGLGIPMSDLLTQIQAAKTILGDHPYAVLVKGMTLDPQRNPKEIHELAKETEVVDADLHFFPLARTLWSLRAEPESAGFIGQNIWAAILRHRDDTTFDLEQTGAVSPNPTAEFGEKLRVVSPYCPQGITELIAKEASLKPATMKEWEAEFGQHPGVLLAAANRYQKLGLLDDAERCLKSYIERSPDSWGYSSLAKLYQQRKQTDKWKATLEESLEHEDFGLSHARTRVSLARYYMGRKEWQEAMPYADAAAETGASWALSCAAECHEMVEDWNASETYTRLDAERYDSQNFSWYYWCLRNGRGDIEAAKKLADRRANQLQRNNSPRDADLLGVYYISSSQDKLARPVLKQAVDKLGNAFCAVNLALLEDAAGDSEARDAALVVAIDRGPAFRYPDGSQDTVSPEVARWLNNVCHLGPDVEPPLELFDESLKQWGSGGVANASYFVGRYFLQQKKFDLARRYLQKCIDSGARGKYTYAAACALLRDLPAAADTAPAKEPEPQAEGGGN